MQHKSLRPLGNTVPIAVSSDPSDSEYFQTLSVESEALKMSTSSNNLSRGASISKSDLVFAMIRNVRSNGRRSFERFIQDLKNPRSTNAPNT